MSSMEFNRLVLDQSENLRPFAISLTRDHDLARDLCQETMYKAFAYRNQYHSGTNIKAWLFTIMRNIFINEYRRKERKRVVMADITSLHSNTIENNGDSKVRMREIHEAIYQLPFIFKTSCLLYLEGYKYHEIAFALNEPLGTIKSRIHFARKILQKQLDR